MKRYIITIIFVIASFLFFTRFAQAASIGDAAGNLHDITGMIGGIVEVIMYVAGVAVFVSAAMKYRLHKQNPQQVHISTPITELVLAIVLVLIPIVTRYGNELVFSDTPPSSSQPVARPQ